VIAENEDARSQTNVVLQVLFTFSRSIFQTLQDLATKDIHHVNWKHKPGTVWDDPQEHQRKEIVVANVVESCIDVSIATEGIDRFFYPKTPHSTSKAPF
jgi:hypothetical protein